MDPVIEPVILANSKFSIDLLKQLCKDPKKNVFFSPLSISSALGLVVLGAKGETADQLSKALHFGKMRIMYHYLYEELYKEGEYKTDKKRSLQLVNRLYGEQTVDFKEHFLDMCEEWCFASFRTVDFKKNPAAAREKINSWVKDKTYEKLKDLLDPEDVSEDTRLALISAVYFEKKWATGFKTMAPNKKDMMVKMVKTDKLPLGTIPHNQNKKLPAEAQILEIPYENHHLSMIIILPNKREDLQKLVDSITYEKIMEWTEPDNMILTDVNVEMPKFKLQESYGLNEALQALGITELFSDQCKLPNMSSEKLKMSKVVHKSGIEVNEEGTVAVAGDGEDVNKTLRDDPPTSITVKPPFLFFIRHNPTKSIVFWGRFISP
ncbi:leukocyte elastase inhibitor-like isoform X1 [Carassius auratus]|uniref:Leukocyte elastase inhibitor-like isoform X1 n=1 Tax=Carassius auratus TaxID=7957 RepID=A0A6P6MJ44_CARAU|nr:leukocyte elastase inhibitor-like isoform X1 [Carassius auratus]